MKITRLKSAIEKRLYPLAKKIEAHPNQITLLSIIATAAGTYLVASGSIFLGLCFFALGGILDLLDGTVAKAKKIVTKLGSFLDKFADRVNDFLMLIAPVIIGAVNYIVGFIAIGLVLIGSYASALLDSHTKNKQTGSGLSMRAVRMILFILGGLFYLIEPAYWEYAYFAIIFIAAYSLIKRLHYALNHI